MFSVTAFCSSQVTLNLWTEFSDPQSKQMMDGLVEEFNKQHQNINVKHRAIGNEVFFSTLRTGLAGSHPPDLFQHEGYYHLAKFASEGLVKDITDWYKNNSSRFLSGGAKANMYNGNIYGIPLSMHTESHIFYNKDILEKNDIGIPETWSEFINACEKLKKNGVTPIAFGTKDAWPGKQWFEIFLVQLVGSERVWDTINMNEDSHWDDPMFIKAAKYYENLYKKGYFQNGCASADYGMAVANFTSGKTAFFHTGTWFFYSQKPPNFNWDFFTFPKLPEGTGDTKQIAAMFIEDLSICSKTKHPEEAMQFLDWISEKQQAEEFVKANRISAIKGAFENSSDSKMLRIMDQAENASGTIAGLELCLPPEVGEDVLCNGAVAIVSGQMNADEWMKAVEEAAEKAKESGELLKISP